ncbi:GDP-L-fucose synthase family protein, partial [Bacteroidota bacterium]
GMVGSSVLRKYLLKGDTDVITKEITQLDLTRQDAVEEFFTIEKPDQVIIAAAKVGGILANNKYRAQFIYENLMIESNIINSAYKAGTGKVLFLGSSCIYPKFSHQPIKEEYLLTDTLEYTNEPYAIAKIAGIKLCESYYKQYGCNYISIMPTNLYGPCDNFNLETSHVIPALIRKFHEARLPNNNRNNKNAVKIWGSGKPRREFLHVDDLADACYYIMNNINAEDIYEEGVTHLNIGTGKDIAISELAYLIKDVVGFDGKVEYDLSKPDGTPGRLLDVSRVNKLGWKYSIELGDGLKHVYRWFVENFDSIRK